VLLSERGCDSSIANLIINVVNLSGTFQRVDLASRTADIASMFRSAFEKAQLQFGMRALKEDASYLNSTLIFTQLEVNCTPISCDTYVDPAMWEKIVLNLLSNAFKYTLSGGVTVTLSEVYISPWSTNQQHNTYARYNRRMTKLYSK